MLQFHIHLIQTVLHFSAILICVFAVLKRWGYFWLIPTAASACFFSYSICIFKEVSKNETLVEGAELLIAIVPVLGTFLWMLSLLILQQALKNKKSRQVAKNIFLEESAANYIPKHIGHSGTDSIEDNE